MTSKSSSPPARSLYTLSLYDTITCNLHKMKFYYKTNNKYKKNIHRDRKTLHLENIGLKFKWNDRYFPTF